MSRRGLEILDADDCYRLLREQSLGRIGLKLANEFVILPVYYAVVDRDIAFRTDPGTKLAAAVMGMRVAFEVDSVVPEWSVLCSGHAHEIRNMVERDRIQSALSHDWPDGERESFVRIEVDRVSGRRVLRAGGQPS